LFGKDSLENVVLSECISVEGITDKLRNILHQKVQKPQVPFLSNFHKFKKAVEIVMETKNDITIGDLLGAFEEPAVFALKVIYNLGGENLKIDYTMSLSCYHFDVRQPQPSILEESTALNVFNSVNSPQTSHNKTPDRAILMDRTTGS
jgi:hypothetical protein